MFTNDKRQEERTGKYGTPRHNHLQQLVTEFQSPKTTQQTKEKIVANLANFAYDPYNNASLRDLNVLELFLDCLTDEPNERLTEFAAAGICNAAADPANARVVADCGGVDAVVGCLSSPVRNTVRYGIAGLYYLWESGLGDVRRGLKEREDVVELVRKFCEVGEFAHLAQALLDKILAE